jgi:hypothetical protein
MTAFVLKVAKGSILYKTDFLALIVGKTLKRLKSIAC